MTFFTYHFQHAFQIFDYIMVPKPQNTETIFSKISIPLVVFFFIVLMLATIQLDYDSFLETDKIHDIVLDRLLAPELYSVQLP